MNVLQEKERCSMETQEKNFEESIEKYLVTKGGYHISDGLGYDRLKGYNPKVLIDFIASTQNKKWMKLMSIHGEYTKDYFLKKKSPQPIGGQEPYCGLLYFTCVCGSFFH